MRCTTILAVVCGLLLGGLLAGCGEPSPETKQVEKKAGETWEAIKAWSIKKKDEFLQSAPGMLEAMKQKMVAAKNAAASAGGEAAKGLESQWQVVQEKYDAMAKAGGEQWEKAREAFVKAYEELSRKVAGTTPEEPKGP